MVVVSAERLRRLGTKIYTSLGLSEEKAWFVSDTLVEANLTGHDSHGIRYLPKYAYRILDGHIVVDAEPEIYKETPVSALIDGKNAFGQITAKKIMETAVEKAKENMVASVGAFNCNHLGRLGYYTEWVAKQDIIAIMFVNVGNPQVSVFNGFGKAFGTNPYSVSLPTGSETPFLVDFATSVVASGKLYVAGANLQKIPTHWTRDKNGGVNDDPNILDAGGWLLPFGEHKGYGLQMVSELLGAVLTGSRTGWDVPRIPPSTNGPLMIALNPEAFIGLNQFKTKTAVLLKQVKEIPAIPGERVLVPGEPEKESKEKRLREGIPIPKDTWDSIRELCEELGIQLNTI